MSTAQTNDAIDRRAWLIINLPGAPNRRGAYDAFCVPTADMDLNGDYRITILNVIRDGLVDLATLREHLPPPSPDGPMWREFAPVRSARACLFHGADGRAKLRIERSGGSTLYYGRLDNYVGDAPLIEAMRHGVRARIARRVAASKQTELPSGWLAKDLRKAAERRDALLGLNKTALPTNTSTEAIKELIRAREVADAGFADQIAQHGATDEQLHHLATARQTTAVLRALLAERDALRSSVKIVGEPRPDDEPRAE